MVKKCVACKVVGLIAAVGALNWGLVVFANYNLVDSLLGAGSMGAKIIYGLVGLAGAILIASLFVKCPACKKD